MKVVREKNHKRKVKENQERKILSHLEKKETKEKFFLFIFFIIQKKKKNNQNSN